MLEEDTGVSWFKTSPEKSVKEFLSQKTSQAWRLRLQSSKVEVGRETGDPT
jgi:hypothetical protein